MWQFGGFFYEKTATVMVILCFYKSCVNVFRLTARLLGRMFKGERLAEGLG